MILALDTGNTQIMGGLFDGDDIRLRFRKTSIGQFSSDELGVFFRSVLRENDTDPKEIQAISLCSVVPSVVYSLKSACIKYFDKAPFVLEPGVRTGLRIRYKNPSEVGADRIANAIAAIDQFPDKNIIIIDMGTATTFCAISRDKDYLGGTIMTGMKLSMQALESRTAKLPSVEILRPTATLGTTTVASIQSGLYYSHLGAMKEVIGRLKAECFNSEEPLVIGTGGLSQLFESEGLFHHRLPDLALQGLRKAYLMNQ